MSRLLVVGYGDAAGCGDPLAMGPGRRARQFASALATEGHDTTALWVVPEHGGNGVGGGTRRFEAATHVEERVAMAGSLEGGEGSRWVRSLGVDAVVAATVHASAFAARNLAGELPLWADVFGDPMAEAQAKSARDQSDLSIARYWEPLVAALERGDRFSAVSRAQAFALLGQLGLAGRLSRRSVGTELVSVIPCSAERRATVGDEEFRGLVGVSAEAFVVVFGGSFNTWCDTATLLSAVERAMDENDAIHFAVTGGAVPGHDHRTHEDFVARVKSSHHRSKIHLLGWLTDAALGALYRRAHAALNVERPVCERALGAENRVVDWIAEGLAVITTGQSESGREMIEAGAVLGVPPCDPDALARAVVELSNDPARRAIIAKRGRDYAAAHASHRVTTAPLLAWCDSPVRAGDAGHRPIRVALASEPRALAGLLEEYLAGLGPFELGYRSIRWLWRRAIGRTRSGG